MSASPLTVVKIGGAVLDRESMLEGFLDDFAALPGSKLLVHGGGAQASRIGARMGIEARMHRGRRITDAATLELVLMVYAGLINKRLVAALQSRACNALGLTGADGNLITARRRQPADVDFGLVGDPRECNAAALDALLQADMTPVLAPLTHDGAGALLNTNADTIAAELASTMAATRPTRLYYCFELPGVMAEPRQPDSLIADLSERDYHALRARGGIGGGMLPKLHNAFQALKAGVKDVVICCADAIGSLDQDVVGTRLLRDTDSDCKQSAREQDEQT